MRLCRLVLPMLFPCAAVAWTSISRAQPPASQAPAAPEPPPAPPPPPPPPAAAAQSSFVSLGGDWNFGFHGFAGASFYVQDTPAFVFNGQGPLIPLSKPANGFTTGADIRQSRFNFSLAGPKVMGGATPKAVVEIDFFGLNGPGAFGEVSVLPRLRLAYAELKWGNDLLRFGQDYQLVLGLIPESIGHLAYPATYFNGLIGWREPGIGYFHTIPMEGSKLELAVQISKSDWQSPSDFLNTAGAPNTANVSGLAELNPDLGQLSGWPAIEARAKYSTENAMAFVAAHYNRVMGTHAGDVIVAPAMGMIPTRNWDVYAITGGAKIKMSGFTFGANAYVGENLGPLLGEQLQFFTTNNVAEWGGWAEAGYDITDHLNAFLVAGTSRPKESDINAGGGGRQSSSLVGGMIRYQEGGFALGPEFYHVMARDVDKNGVGVASGAGAPTGEIDVNQFMFSGMFFF
jgi:hypothetical protein